MAHLVRVRAPGQWLTGTTLLGSELESLDAQLFTAINGDAGGTWAPAAIIIIGGSGLRVTGPLDATGTTTFVGITCSGTANFNGAVNLGNAAGDLITVAGATTFNSTVDFSQGTFFNAAVDMNSTLNVDGAAQFNADVAIGNASGDALQVNATATFSAPTNLNGAVTINDPVTLGGDGHIRWRVITGANANTTYNVTTADEIFVPSGVLSADRTYTVADGTVTGQRIRFVTRDPTWQITIQRSDLSSIGVMQLLTASRYTWMELVWVSGAWQLSAFHAGGTG